MKKLALVGAKGMLGRDLLNRLKRSCNCFPVDIEELDITRIQDVLQWIDQVRPEILINAAAYTDVDGCESHRDLAMTVNGEGPGYLASACARFQVAMIHLSTDFVFDGTRKGPYTEEEQPNPLSIYGASKLLGEKRIAEHLDRFLIVRTSWLYGLGGRNFVEAILAKAGNKKTLRVVQDQVGSPTYVPDLSGAIERLMTAEAEGVVHVSNSGECSWFGFAGKILEFSGIRDVTVEPILSSEIGRPARRPANSVLSCKRYAKLTGQSMRPWEEGLRDYLKERGTGE